MVRKYKDIYNSEKKVNRLLGKLRNLNRYDAHTLREFYHYLYIDLQFRAQTIYEHLKYLYNLSLYFDIRLKSINKKNIKYIKELINNHTQGKEKARKKYYVAIKHLLRFLGREHLTHFFIYRKKKEKPSIEILEPDIINKIINTLKGEHKIITMIAWETGARVKELFNIKKEDLFIMNEVIVIRISDVKSGEERIAFVKEYYQDFLHFLNSKHIGIGDYIFSTTYDAYRKALRIVSKRLNLYKHITPKMFRKFRATYSALSVNETTLRSLFGWSFNSDTPKHYIQLAKLLTYDTINKIPTLANLTKKKFVVSSIYQKY